MLLAQRRYNGILDVFIRFGFLCIICMFGCQEPRQDGPLVDGTLFKSIEPEKSGIDFSNTLYETDTFNSIFYEYYYNGSGLAIGDVNNDGLSDIFFGSNMDKSRLYLNKGNLEFEDITEKAGINTSGSWITGVSLVDLNMDGWLDIYLCVGGNIVDDYRNLLFMNNGANGILTFTEKAHEVGLDDDRYSTQASFFDYDRDGDLDVYILTSSMNIPNKNALRGRVGDGSMRNTDRLYRNDGHDPATGLPSFTDVSRNAGIVWDGFGLGICVSDINLDGWPDIYIANDYITNDLLYINNGNGTFTDKCSEYFKHTSYSAMGMDIADINNDGLVEVFTLDMLPEDYFRKRIMAGNMREFRRYQAEIEKGYAHQFTRNMLHLNNGEISGTLSFSEIGQLAGVQETDWSWAPLFADFDNDGFRDLFIGNGIPQDISNMDFSTVVQNQMRDSPDMPFSILNNILREELLSLGNVKKPNVMYRNTGHLLFDDKTVEWGLGRPSFSTGAAFSDLDNDGDLDLVLNNLNDPASLYENTLSEKNSADSISHYLKIKLYGSRFDRGGIGAKIWLYAQGQQQYYEHFPVRGFQSMVDPEIHFGFGETYLIDSIHVCWPDGKRQKISGIMTDQLITLEYENSAVPDDPKIITGPQSHLFKEVSREKNILFFHKEKEFVDFNIQPLLPHMYSQEGPGISVGDVNSDGLDDFFIGGATGSFGTFFIQNPEGSFTAKPLHDNPNYEDMGSLLFDADGDGDDDLYVVSGGTGLPPGNPFYNDRLYMNDGEGNFSYVAEALPDTGICGSQVLASDFDRDGDLDLFVCGRIKLENYPFPERSILLRNDSKGSDLLQFTDVTTDVAEDLQYAGLISAALWTDYDLDGWTDLIFAGEWMPVKIFRNVNGNFEDVTPSSGISEYTGWWNSITGADFDKDGDIDYVAGNLGLNTRFKASPEQPLRILAKDFDRNGYVDPICTYYVQGKSYPIYHRNVMMDQMPFIQTKYKRYEEYARATIDDILDEDQLEDAYIADAQTLNTSYFENLGNGTFAIHPLPMEAQFAPVFGLLANDYNGDENCDLLMVGNSYAYNVEDGRHDAFIGLFMEGNGEGGFKPVLSRESGFFVDGDAKGMAELILRDEQSLVLAARNSGQLVVYETVNSSKNIVRLNRDDQCADILYKNGRKEHREFYYGSGYLSSSSRMCRLSENVVSITITTFSGDSRIIEFSRANDG